MEMHRGTDPGAHGGENSGIPRVQKAPKGARMRQPLQESRLTERVNGARERAEAEPGGWGSCYRDGVWYWPESKEAVLDLVTRSSELGSSKGRRGGAPWS